MDTHEYVIQRLQGTRCLEARAWLGDRSGERFLGEMERSGAINFVAALYAVGALEVIVAEVRDVPEWPGAQSSEDVLVRLPSETRARHQLFEAQRNLAEAMGFEGTEDTGQSLLYFKLS